MNESRLMRDEKRREISWLVEAWHEGKSDGYYFTAPEIGYGGWRTDDVTQAARYSEAEAKAVAHALTYFHSPFKWSNWVATEHVFISESPSGECAHEQFDRDGSCRQCASLRDDVR